MLFQLQMDMLPADYIQEKQEGDFPAICKLLLLEA